MKHLPYTYLIGWTNQQKYYYGVRYSKTCHPDNLFKTYFTSSKYVKEFIKQYGIPDLIQIRKTFINKDDAILWESKVLTRMNVVKDDRWLNHTNNKAIVCNRTPETVEKFKKKMKGRSSPFKGKKHSAEAKKLIGLKNKEKLTGRSRIFSQEWKDNIGKSSKGRIRLQPQSEKDKRKILAKEQNFSVICVGRIWINNGIINKRVYPDEIKNYSGYTQGRLIKKYHNENS